MNACARHGLHAGGSQFEQSFVSDSARDEEGGLGCITDSDQMIMMMMMMSLLTLLTWLYQLSAKKLCVRNLCSASPETVCSIADSNLHRA